ncbi:solute carrier family 45 member 4-like [Thalassophryne amazonica]|uniref:solute carrier family 45 member 4-like n=1 Tax=Thalassophryne amazonica TaxID=390379 RepID=UPI001472357B|nr:solute carrier family 45 member 4-like [Thalassophryne amazonica]
MEEDREREKFGLPGSMKSEEESDVSENTEGEEGRCEQIPLRRWLMHGAVMFGREFCYAIEMALVTPILLQIGLPEQYYSLTWFLSPILGLFFTPVIGSASDRCKLSWGRRRPFILALCVGVLLGVALFLNGSIIGLSVGDTPSNQRIGIILTVVGVVVLDFAADAADGPIRAYLLDVAHTEEQDIALNIHAFSAGLGGAVGYVLGGVDWAGTALGFALKSQEQVLFLFTAIIFIISVTLHMLSIPEKPFDSVLQLKCSADRMPSSQSSLRLTGEMKPSLGVIPEDVTLFDAPFRAADESLLEGMEMDFLCGEPIRCKSDSVLAVPDSTIELDPDLNPYAQHFLPEEHHFLPKTDKELEDVCKSSDYSSGSADVPPFRSPALTDGMLDLGPTETVPPQLKDPVGRPSPPPPQISTFFKDTGLKTQTEAASGTNAAMFTFQHSQPTKHLHPFRQINHRTPHAPAFYRQPSFTISYYGRVGLRHVDMHRKTFQPITTSRSLNDLSDLKQRLHRCHLYQSVSSLSSETSSSVDVQEEVTTVRLLWLSMFKMPRQLWRLCVCHLLTWFAIIAESVFYTDFMGQVVYHGDPTAPANSTELLNYNKGVQMGCWGMMVYAATAAVCSAILQKSLDHFDLSVKIIYIIGTLSFCIGTAIMSIFPNVYVSVVMISSMGIISMSISYCPYALLGQYHEISEYIHHSPGKTRRGFGIDCAILSCQVYISQILVASLLGPIVELVGSVRAISVVASGGAFLGFLSACFLVIYPELEHSILEQDRSSEGVSGDNGPDGHRTNQTLTLLDRSASVV